GNFPQPIVLGPPGIADLTAHEAEHGANFLNALSRLVNGCIAPGLLFAGQMVDSPCEFFGNDALETRRDRFIRLQTIGHGSADDAFSYSVQYQIGGAVQPEFTKN